MLWAIASVTAMAQSQGYITPITGTSTCILVKWESNPIPTSVPYHLTGMANECHRFHWYTRGDLQIDGISADSLTVYVSSVSTNPDLRSKDFGKGRLYVTYWEENISSVCGDPVKYYDIYKTFTDTTIEIIGPDCISEGDTVTFSIDALVSVNLNQEIGMDHYYWDWSQGLIDDVIYFSGDSSSITFRVGTLTGYDTLFVDMGQCNLDDGFRYTKVLGQAIKEPVFVAGKEPASCMPFNVASDTIILVPQNNATYSWNLGSWSVIHTSELGDTIIFTPATNAQEIILTATGSCEEKDFKYQISRSLTSSDTLDFSSKCLQAGSSVRFSVAGVPDGTLMEWEVSGTDWYIDPKIVNTTKPFITVGSDTGIISVKTKDCSYTITDTILIRPNKPVIIFGDSCLAGGDASNKTYYVAPVAHADSYQWTYPAGWSVVGADDEASITLHPNGANGGTLKVRAVGCSESPWESKQVNMIGIKPTGITPIPDCINVGMADTITLNVTGTASGQTYGWKFIPEDFGTIYSANSDSSTVTIYTSGIENEYEILVRAHTSCGYSDWDTTTVSIQGLLIDEFRQMSNAAGIYYRLYPYDFDETEYNITWILNDTIVTNTNYNDRTKTLRGGLIGSTTNDFYVLIEDTTTHCITKRIVENPEFMEAKASNGVQKAKASGDVQKTKAISDVPEIVISPNPTNSILNISLSNEGDANVTIADYSGKIVRKLGNQPQNFTIDVSSLSNGIYAIIVVQNGKRFGDEFIKK